VHRLLLFLAATLATAGAVGQVRFEGGNGSSPALAVVLVGARSLDELESTQLRWVSERFVGAKIDTPASRYLLSSRVYRAVAVTQADGSKTTVYFDVTDMPTK
jgi:hypothetical protein